MLLIVFLISLSSCSTLKRSQFYASLGGAIIGGSIGALVGKSLSPNKESDQFNRLLGIGIGSLIGGVSGHYISKNYWNQNPQNYPLTPILKEEAPPQMPTQTIKYVPVVNPKMIPIEATLPPFLTGKVKKGKVMTFEIPEYQEQNETGEVIYHESHKAYKYIIE